MRWYSKGTKRTLRYFPKKTAAALFSAIEGKFAGGLAFTGKSTSYFFTIDKFVIATAAKSVGFNSLINDRGDLSGGASQVNGSRFLAVGGYDGVTIFQAVDYVDFGTGGVASDFGDLATALYFTASFSNATNLYRACGYNPGAGGFFATIGKFSFTPGNESTAGLPTYSAGRLAPSGYGSTDYGFTAGGLAVSVVEDSIDRFVFATETLTQDFGTMSDVRFNMGLGANATRVISAGGTPTGSTFTNVIEYIEVATGGAVTDFGDLAVTRGPNCSACSQATMVISMGGTSGSSYTNVASQVQFATAANDTSFNTFSQRGWGAGYGGSP